jgi:hypothetical protein
MAEWKKSGNENELDLADETPAFVKAFAEAPAVEEAQAAPEKKEARKVPEKKEVKKNPLVFDELEVNSPAELWPLGSFKLRKSGPLTIDEVDEYFSAAQELFETLREDFVSQPAPASVDSIRLAQFRVAEAGEDPFVEDAEWDELTQAQVSAIIREYGGDEKPKRTRTNNSRGKSTSRGSNRGGTRRTSKSRGSDKRIQIRDPNAPVTEAQIGLIERLAGEDTPEYIYEEGFTRGDANELIQTLMDEQK